MDILWIYDSFHVIGNSCSMIIMLHVYLISNMDSKIGYRLVDEDSSGSGPCCWDSPLQNP